MKFIQNGCYTLVHMRNARYYIIIHFLKNYQGIFYTCNIEAKCRKLTAKGSFWIYSTSLKKKLITCRLSLRDKVFKKEM